MRRLRHSNLRRDGEHGVVAVWVALTMVVLLGFAGWAVDFSRWNDERAHMQKAADAAALAGAVYLPDDPAGAVAAATSIAAKNGYSSGVSATILSNANQLKVIDQHLGRELVRPGDRGRRGEPLEARGERVRVADSRSTSCWCSTAPAA